MEQSPNTPTTDGRENEVDVDVALSVVGRRAPAATRAFRAFRASRARRESPARAASRARRVSPASSPTGRGK